MAHYGLLTGIPIFPSRVLNDDAPKSRYPVIGSSSHTAWNRSANIPSALGKKWGCFPSLAGLTLSEER